MMKKINLLKLDTESRLNINIDEVTKAEEVKNLNRFVVENLEALVLLDKLNSYNNEEYNTQKITRDLMAINSNFSILEDQKSDPSDEDQDELNELALENLDKFKFSNISIIGLNHNPSNEDIIENGINLAVCNHILTIKRIDRETRTMIKFIYEIGFKLSVSPNLESWKVSTATNGLNLSPLNLKEIIISNDNFEKKIMLESFIDKNFNIQFGYFNDGLKDERIFPNKN